MASKGEKSKKTINLAIRDFALPVPRTGSIEVNSGYGQIFGGPMAQAAEGRKIHLALQKERQKQYAVYKSEVKLAEKFETENFVFNVSGRMDGFVDGVTPMVEEIKSSTSALELAQVLRTDWQHPYGLQVATYAYILFKQREVVPRAHLVVVSNKGEVVDEFDYPFSVESYEKWLALRLDELEREAQAEEARRQRRKKTATALLFPFETPRPFQRELVDNLAADLKESAHIIVQAPTGLGKTIGVMYPALLDSLSRGERFVYVTPKNSQHAVAEDAVQRLSQAIDIADAGEAGNEDSAILFSTTLNAKAKMCLKEEVICNPSYCQYARDYYKKVDEAKLVEKLANVSHLGAEQFKAVGEEYEVCPFELSLDTVQNSDVVIGDYNYVFSPRSILGRLTFSLSKNNEKPNLVIDEAHNLPGRATDYFSKSLNTRELVELGSALTDMGFAVAVEGKKIVSNILFTISTVGRTVNQRDAKVNLSPLLFESHLADLQALAGRYVESKSEGQAKGGKRDSLLTLVNLVTDFCDALAYEGEEFLHLYVRNKLPDGGFEESLRVVCCDASAQLKLAHKEFAHVVAFSATIRPFEYFSQLSGLHEEDLKTREYQSPFPSENRKLLIIPQVSTKFADRGKNYGKIAEAINRIVAVRPGNYFVFFPSYLFLSAVFDKVKVIAPDTIRMVRQESEMSAAKAQELLASLLAKDKPTLVFAVQGGVLAEGVDYPGEMIIGAIVVGPGLPNYNFEREQIRQFYDSRYGSGFDYAYVYPAMAKVVQAAGRVIRSDEDRGLIVLMDQRFIEKQYALAMPSDWFEKNASELVSRSIIQDISQFWQRAAVIV